MRPTWRIALILLLAAGGCSAPRIIPAGGRVTYKGQGVPSTLVTFIPDDGNRPSKAITDDQGNFKLLFSKSQEGVMRGKCTVVLRYEMSAEEETKMIPPKASREVKAVIAKYSDEKASPLHFDVEKPGQHIDICSGSA